MLFSAPMVRALLAGTKTQTRRTTGLPRMEELQPGFWHLSNAHGGRVGVTTDRISEVAPDYTAIQPGDRLWVKETWRVPAQDDRIAPRDLARQIIGYEADCSPGTISATGKVRVSIHMPRWASRLTLHVTDVRVERLQSISEADAAAEGIVQIGRFFGVADADWDSASTVSAVDAYANLWEDINGAGSWDKNPWVAAYTFDVERSNIDQARSA